MRRRRIGHPHRPSAYRAVRTDDGKLALAQVPRDTPQVDEKRIENLVDQLGELSDAVRSKATDELQRIGPSAWPILRNLSADQLPETQQRVAMLLASANAPALG